MKKICSFLLVLALCGSLIFCVSAKSRDSRLTDQAKLLTSHEEDELLDRLDDVSEEFDMDVVILTVEDLDGDTPKDFAEDYYEDQEFAQDGILLLVSMQERDYYILPRGFAEEAIDRGDLDNICQIVQDSLREDEYEEAFHDFVDQVEQYVNGYINGNPFDVGGNLAVCLIIGLVIGWIATSVMKGELKSVRSKQEANAYVKSGSMHLTHSGDFFLYRHVTRREKPQNHSSSASGSSRGGAGGKF